MTTFLASPFWNREDAALVYPFVRAAFHALPTKLILVWSPSWSSERLGEILQEAHYCPPLIARMIFSTRCGVIMSASGASIAGMILATRWLVIYSASASFNHSADSVGEKPWLIHPARHGTTYGSPRRPNRINHRFHHFSFLLFV